MSILRFLYQTLLHSYRKKDRKHIEQNFHSVAHSCWGHAPGGGTSGAGWVKNLHGDL